MIAKMNATVLSVESGESKNGEWNNILLFDKESRQSLELFTRKTRIAKSLPFDVPVTVIIDVSSNKFGTNLEFLGFEE